MAIKESIISFSFIFKKTPRSIKMTKQSSKSSSLILFLNLFLTKFIAENALSILVVATDRINTNLWEASIPNHKYYAYLFEQASLRAQQYNYQVAFQSLNKSELEKSLRLNVHCGHQMKQKNLRDSRMPYKKVTPC
jgi:hypothetical protein